MPPLATEASDLGDGDPLNPDLPDRSAHLVQLEGLDDGGDELHGAAHRAPAVPAKEFSA
jgi:hypothetical protein